MAWYKCPKSSKKIPSWSDATDAELQEVINGYYAGTISLSDIKSVWNIGDERNVDLSRMSAINVGESHVAQTVTFVIMNWKGKKLSDDTDCLAIVGQKNCLANGTTLEGGYMNARDSSPLTWGGSARKKWCNNEYMNAIPSDFRALFKQFKNVTGNGTTSTAVTTLDYFALPSEKEIYGSTREANSTAETSNTQFEYYKTSANRIKKSGNSGSASRWWERSPSTSNSTWFCRVDSNGSASSYAASNTSNGLAPFGVI